MKNGTYHIQTLPAADLRFVLIPGIPLGAGHAYMIKICIFLLLFFMLARIIIDATRRAASAAR